MRRNPIGSCWAYGLGAIMSGLKPLDLGSLTARPELATSAPVAPSVPIPPQSLPPQSQRPNDQRTWIMVAMAAVIVCLLVMLLAKRGVLPVPTPTPDIDISGQYVLFVVDEDGKGNLSTEQLAVTNSAKVADWCTDHDVEYRRFDVEEDLRLEEPVWSELVKLVDRPPAMVTLKDGKATVREFPDGVDDAIDQLSGVFK